MPNHKYQLARQEAIKRLAEKYPKIIDFPSTLLIEELEELTCEIYAMKFADWLQPNSPIRDSYYAKVIESWVNYSEGVKFIGSTSEVHELFKNDKA